jgi:tyrosine-protein kinase Etk/Wzc
MRLTSSIAGSYRSLAPEIGAKILESCKSASLNLGGPLLRSVGVTSALRGEGRTTIALAMAIVQAQTYDRNALVVEMEDFKHIGLAQRLGANAGPGLAELLAGTATLVDVIQPVSRGLSVITAGGKAEGPAALLDGLRNGLLEELGASADVTVLDLPPLLESGVARVAATTLECLLVVVKAGATRMPLVQEATAHLAREPQFLLNGTQSRVPELIRRLIGG